MPIPTRLRAPIGTAQLTAMRGMTLQILTSTCTIQRNTTPLSDSMGGEEPDWDPLATLVPCRVVDSTGLSENERLAAERITSDQPWLVALPQGTDVTPRDRIVVGTRTFEVLAVNDGQTDETVRRCLCRLAA